MKATINNQDPIKQRLQRGRRIAGSITLVVLLALGLTAFFFPQLLQATMNMPTAEEREKAKKERKKNSKKKRKRVLSKKDIEKLAKQRDKKARKHLIKILQLLEQRIIIAEKQEAEMTAKFRDRADIFPSLRKLITDHSNKAATEVNAETRPLHKDYSYQQEPLRGLWTASRSLYRLHFSLKDPNCDMAAIHSTSASIEKQLRKGANKIADFDFSKQTYRYIKSIQTNSQAVLTEDRDLAVRGFAQPEDHPLSSAQRSEFLKTISPYTLAQLHKLSQDMASHYQNLMGDVNAGKLAEAANISYPEALDKIAHQPYAKDDLQEQLNQSSPENIDQLDELTDAQNEAKMSAERALEESGGKVPGEGKDGNGSEDGQGGSEDGNGDGGSGPFGGGSGDGTENSLNDGPETARGQITDEKVWRSLALDSALAVNQNRTRSILVGEKEVLANVLRGRRFTSESQRKGYLYIDTWHIIGPWDAKANHRREFDFSQIYPLEKKINLDAKYTTGKTQRLYDDERGYAGKGKLSGKLDWKFYQSPTVEVRIPREMLANDALYFAYTEVYFEQDSTLNLAIASDDAALIRVNGKAVFKDTGHSKYNLSEQVREVKFKKGINKILVRLANGSGPCRFSLLLLPQSEK